MDYLIGWIIFKNIVFNEFKIYRLQYLFPAQYDVGVDNGGYAPISWTELKSKFEKFNESDKNMIHYKPLEFE